MIYTQRHWEISEDEADLTDLNKKCMATVKGFASDYDYKVEQNKSTISDPRVQSDVFRYHLAQNNPDAIWVDNDVEMLEDFKSIIEPGAPYTDFRKGNPHNAIIIVNGCCEFFESLEKERKKRGIELNTLALVSKLLRRHKDFVRQIPDEMFIHHFASSIKTIKLRTGAQ